MDLEKLTFDYYDNGTAYLKLLFACAEEILLTRNIWYSPP